MPIYRLSLRALALLACLAAAAACSADAASSPGLDDCGATCSHVEDVCGTAASGCAATCAGQWSATARACVRAAVSCGAIGACDAPAVDAGGERDATGAEDARPAVACPMGFVGAGVDSCPSACRRVTAGGSTGTYCTRGCSVDADCGDPSRYVCNTTGGYCSIGCGDDSACAGFRACNTARKFCTM